MTTEFNNKARKADYAKLGTAVRVKTTAGNTYRFLNGAKVTPETRAQFDAITTGSEGRKSSYGGSNCPAGVITVWA